MTTDAAQLCTQHIVSHTQHTLPSHLSKDFLSLSLLFFLRHVLDQIHSFWETTCTFRWGHFFFYFERSLGWYFYYSRPFWWSFRFRPSLGIFFDVGYLRKFYSAAYRGCSALIHVIFRLMVCDDRKMWSKQYDSIWFEFFTSIKGDISTILLSSPFSSRHDQNLVVYYQEVADTMASLLCGL